MRKDKREIAACVLAAGKGTRMKSAVPKVLHEVHSRPMITLLIEALKKTGVKKIAIVTNKGAKAAIKEAVDGVDFVEQKTQLGSGDAVNSARDYFSKFQGEILIMCGDTPLITGETIERLISEHIEKRASCTILTAVVPDPTGYGRIIRDDDARVARIIEEENASLFEKATEEINVGAYCFNKEDLFSALGKIRQDPAKKEYYLTDVVALLKKSDKKIHSVATTKEYEYLGINSRVDLANANKVLRKSVLEELMLEGVTIVDPDATFVDRDARIARDTIIYPNCHIERDVVVGRDCSVGPFARLRPGVRVEDGVIIGNFAELVRTSVGQGTKINHMSYLGDAAIGKNVNIGAGAVTANYDGAKKNKTIIEDGAFIGVGAILIAPVRIGKNAVVGAGAVVTKNKNVPAGKVVAGVPAAILKRGH